MDKRIEAIQTGLSDYAYILTSNWDMSRDLYQDTMERLQKKIHLYKEERGAFTTWAYRIMRNIFIDQYRVKKRHNQNLLYVETEAELRGGGSSNITPEHLFGKSQDPNPEDILHRKDTSDLIKEAYIWVTRNTSYTMTKVWEHRYIHKKKLKDIAHDLDIPIGTVKSYLHKLKYLLKQQHGNAYKKLMQ